MPKLPERAAKEDPTIATYLLNKQNLFTARLDAERRKAIIQQVNITGQAQRATKAVQEFPMFRRN